MHRSTGSKPYGTSGFDRNTHNTVMTTIPVTMMQEQEKNHAANNLLAKNFSKMQPVPKSTAHNTDQRRK